MMGGMGSLALNQLLVTMDGVDNPPFFKKFWTNRVNSFFDAIYIVPRRVGEALGLVLRSASTSSARSSFLNSLLDSVVDARALRPAHASPRLEHRSSWAPGH